MADKINKKDLFGEDIIKFIQELRNELEATKKTMVSLAKEAKTLNKQMASSKGVKELSESTKKAATNQKKLTEAEKQELTLKKSLEKQQAKINYLRSEEGKKVLKATEALKREQRELRNAAKAQDAGAKSTNKWSKALGSFAFKFNALGNIVSNVTSAITRGFIRAARAAAETITKWDSATRNLASILQTTRENTKKLNAEAKLLGSTSKFTAAQITELQTALAKKGLSSSEISASTKAISKMATALDSDLGESAKVAAIAMRVFDKDATEMNDIVSALAVSTTKSGLEFADFETILSTLGPVAESYNFSLEDTIALTGRLRDAGFDASKAATATRNILLNLADTNGGLAKSLGRPINSLEDLVGGLKELDDRGVSLAETLELTDKRSVSAFNRFLSGADTVLTLKNSIIGVNNELDEMVNEQMKSMKNETLLVQSAWQGLILAIESGDGIMAKSLSAIKGGIADLLIGLTDLNIAFKRASKLTEDEGSRFYNSMLSKSRDYESLAFQGIVKQTNEIKFAILKAAPEIEKVFKDGLKDLGLNHAKRDLLWDEYYRRRSVDYENDVKAAAAATQRKIEDEEKAVPEIEKVFKDGLKDGLKDLTELEEENIQKEIDTLIDFAGIQKDEAANTLQKFKEFWKEEVKLFKRKEKEKSEAAKKENEDREIEILNLKLDAARTFFSASSILIDNNIKRLEQQRDNEINLAGQTQEAKSAITEKYNKLLNKERKKQSINDKLQSIFEITLNTLVAVTKALPNIPLSIIIGALGAVQAAAVATTPVPKYAKGTDSSPEGVAHVGEKGNEFMIDRKGNVGLSPAKDTLTYLQKGTKIIPADVTKQLLSNTYIANVAASKGEESGIIAAFERSNKELKRAIERKPVTSININNAGITVMTERGRTLTKRIDKYFKN